MTRKKKISIAAAISSTPAIIVATFFTYAMIQHNSQGDAFDPVSGEFQYLYILKFFSLNFIIIFSPVFSLIMFLWLIFFVDDRISGKKNSKK